MNQKSNIAVVTGASQGLGLETCRRLALGGMHVVLTARSEPSVQKGLAALASLIGKEHADSFEGHVLDVSSDRSVDAFLERVRPADIAVLVNNAGRIYGSWDDGLAVTDAAMIADAVDNNALGAWRMIRHVLPAMNRAGRGRIVNVSSGLGQLSDMGAGAVPYRISKTALNAVTRIAAADARGDVKVNAVCPGWVRTDMGGSGASRSVEAGAAGIVWAATLPEDGPSGGFFRDGQPIDW